jgi:hypothetical protein
VALVAKVSTTALTVVAASAMGTSSIVSFVCQGNPR